MTSVAPSLTKKTDFSASDLLCSAISDAYTVIEHCSKNSIKLSDGVARTVAETYQLLKHAEVKSPDEQEAYAMLAEQEEDFWTAYHQISVDIAPATVEGIIISSTFADRSKDRPWDRQNSVLKWRLRGYTLTTWAVVAFTILLQVYWAIGSSIVNDYTQAQTAITAPTASVTTASVVTAAGSDDAVLVRMMVWNRIWSTTLFFVDIDLPHGGPNELNII